MERLESIFGNRRFTMQSEEKLETYRLNRAERITSGDILYILAFLYGRKVKRHEALTFLKKVEGCILDDVENSSKKASYTTTKRELLCLCNIEPQIYQALSK